MGLPATHVRREGWVALRQLEEQVFDGVGCRGIEGCRGFVEEQDFRFERQRTGKAEALLLPPESIEAVRAGVN